MDILVLKNLWTHIDVSLIISIFSGIFSLFAIYISHQKNKEFENYKRNSDKKIESYTELINLTKPFLNDPALTFKEAKNLSKLFIEKYNNEILPFAPKEIVDEVQGFLFNAGTKFANTDSKTKSLFKIIQAIRKDLGLKRLDLETLEFHTINEEQLRKVYSKKWKKSI